MRVLWIGDMHLGRRLPRSVSKFAEDCGLDPQRLLPEAAFRRLVDWAMNQDLRAVVFAGDLVEKMDDRFYALPVLEEGVGRLLAAGVEVLSVCGNHDVDALPRLAKRIKGLRILGAGGRWESVDLEEGGQRLRVTGWSFGAQVVRENPLQNFSLEERPGGGAWVGVLHGDLDGGESPYAPVPRRDLQALPLDAWFLGHVHKPDDPGAHRFIGYLGSLQGLDAGEPGRHGPLLMELEEGLGLRLQRVSLVPLAFESCEMEVGGEKQGFEVLEDRLDHLHQGVCKVLAGLAAESDAEVLAVRLTLRGRVRDLGAVRRFVQGQVAEMDLRAEVGGTKVFVEKVVDRLRPFRDLEELIQGGGPLGRLAAKLHVLEQSGEQDMEKEGDRGEELAKELAKDLSGIKGLDLEEWPMERVRQAALAAGRGVLDALLQEIEEEA